MKKNHAIALLLLGYTLMIFGGMICGFKYNNPFAFAFSVAIAFLISYLLFIKILK